MTRIFEELALKRSAKIAEINRDIGVEVRLHLLRLYDLAKLREPQLEGLQWHMAGSLVLVGLAAAPDGTMHEMAGYTGGELPFEAKHPAVTELVSTLRDYNGLRRRLQLPAIDPIPANP